MSGKKPVSFIVEPTLREVWKRMSLSEEEQQQRISDLEAGLLEYYQNFVAQQFTDLDEMQQTLSKAKTSFEKTKRSFGDFKIQAPLVEKQPLVAQIKAFESATTELNTENGDRKREIEKLYSNIMSMFKQLGATDDEKGEYLHKDDTDFSAGRLYKLRQKAGSLSTELKRRIEVNKVLKLRYKKLVKATEEEPSEAITALIKNIDVTARGMKLLEDECDRLKAIRDTREARIQRIRSEIEELYKLMAIDKRDRVKFPHIQSAKVLEELENELSFLESQKETRLPVVIGIYRTEVERLSDQLGIEHHKRPKYRGNDPVKAVDFYVKAIEDLNAQVQERVSIMEMSKYGESPEDVRQAMEAYNQKYNTTIEAQSSNMPISPYKTQTEVSELTSGIISSPKSVPRATKEDLSNSVHELFSGDRSASRSMTVSSMKTPKSGKAKTLTPKSMSRSDREWREISLRARDPFKL